MSTMEVMVGLIHSVGTFQHSDVDIGGDGVGLVGDDGGVEDGDDDHSDYDDDDDHSDCDDDGDDVDEQAIEQIGSV